MVWHVSSNKCRFGHNQKFPFFVLLPHSFGRISMVLCFHFISLQNPGKNRFPVDKLSFGRTPPHWSALHHLARLIIYITNHIPTEMEIELPTTYSFSNLFSTPAPHKENLTCLKINTCLWKGTISKGIVVFQPHFLSGVILVFWCCSRYRSNICIYIYILWRALEAA